MYVINEMQSLNTKDILYYVQRIFLRIEIHAACNGADI